MTQHDDELEVPAAGRETRAGAPRSGAPRTARERARAELTREIKEEARRQLTKTGADGLSLRAVARELGMVSSALYRYYPSRDDLLTALIIDAYNALGETAEQAIAGAGAEAGAEAGGAARAQWLAACHAIRAWARANPQEYALIYGSPVPGYRAPEATIAPAARVPLAFVGVLARAAEAGELAEGPAAPDGAAAGPPAAPPLPAELGKQAATLLAALAAGPAWPAVPDGAEAPKLAPEVLTRAVIAWTQLFGMVSFELFGQFVGSFEPADTLFAYAVASLAAFAGLR
jgi:AcrR family transcriptional regulator